MMPLDRMPSISLGIIVPAGASFDSHYHWRTDSGVVLASVRFDAGGYSNAHLQGPPAALRELAAALLPGGRPGGWLRHVRGRGGGWLMWADSPDCPACASGWHARCRWPDQAEDGDGELVERCCDGLLIARRRRPLWIR